MANNFQISKADWVSGVNKLGSGEGVLVRMNWSFGHLFGSAYQLKVDGQTIRFLLQGKAPSGSRKIVLEIFLPKDDYGRYERRTETDDRVAFSLLYPDEHGSPSLAAELHLTNSIDLLVGGDLVIQIQ